MIFNRDDDFMSERIHIVKYEIHILFIDKQFYAALRMNGIFEKLMQVNRIIFS